MAKVFIAQSKNGGLYFGTDYNKARFNQYLKENPDKRLRITPDEPITDNLRRFFEGAVVPMFAYQHEVNGKLMSIPEAREALKVEFNPRYIRNLKGEATVIGESTTTLNKQKFMEFIEKITDYMLENGYQIPDAEDYKRWRDTIADIGEIYPPIKKLIDSYERRKKSYVVDT